MNLRPPLLDALLLTGFKLFAYGTLVALGGLRINKDRQKKNNYKSCCLPSIEAFPPPRAAIPLTLVLYVGALDAHVVVVDVGDEFLHYMECLVAVHPLALERLAINK